MMKRQQRFRASIYIDIFVDETKEDCNYCSGDNNCEHCNRPLEEMREEARQKVQEVVKEITNTENHNVPDGVFNPYIGDVAKYNPRDLLHPLDRDI